MRRRRHFLILNLILVCISCQTENHISLHNLKPLSEIESFGDSIFFKTINSMQYIDNKYYILDGYFKRILILDNNRDLLSVFGKPGRGPGELNHPYSFFQYNDSTYISDFGKILIYNNGIFSRSILTTPESNTSKFFVCDIGIYMSNVMDSKAIAVFKNDFSKAEYFGQVYNKGNNPRQLIGINRRHIFQSNDNSIVTSVLGYPVIEKYSGDMHLIDTLSLVNNTYVKSRLEVTNEVLKNPKAYGNLVCDATYNNGKLYVLIYDNDNANENVKYACNKVLVIDCESSKLKLIEILELIYPPETSGIYSSILVNDNQLIAFNAIATKLQIFSLN